MTKGEKEKKREKLEGIQRLGWESTKKGDFKTSKRVYELLDKKGFGTSKTLHHIPGSNYLSSHPDGLALSYEKLGEFEKAAKRYEKLDAPYMAGEMYEREGDFDKARKFYKQVSEDYRGKYGYKPRLIEAAEKGLARVDNAEENIKEKGFRRKSSRLESTSAAAAIIGLIGGLLFLSSNFTGNVIGLNQSTGSIIGSALFIVGLAASFIYFRKIKTKAL